MLTTIKPTLVITAILTILTAPVLAGSANSSLESKPPAERAALFTAAIGKSGFNCGRVTNYLFMGEKRGADWFSLRCRNGQDYALRIQNIEDLPTRALPCKALQAAGAKCWIKFN